MSSMFYVPCLNIGARNAIRLLPVFEGELHHGVVFRGMYICVCCRQVKCNSGRVDSFSESMCHISTLKTSSTARISMDASQQVFAVKGSFATYLPPNIHIP